MEYEWEYNIINEISTSTLGAQCPEYTKVGTVVLRTVSEYH